MYNFVQALSKSLSVREDFSEGFFRGSGFRGSGFGGLGAQDFRGWGFRVWGPGLQGLGLGVSSDSSTTPAKTEA